MRKYDNDKMMEMGKAVELLRPLFDELADEGTLIDVFGTLDTCRGDLIIVRINNAQYEVNVTCENVRSMVRSVVNAVVLKI